MNVRHRHRQKREDLAEMEYANPIVRVTQGKLKGSIQKLLDGTPYFSFKGVPYAHPPVGPLRFRAPLPPKPWPGIREATNHGPVCPQYDLITTQFIEGSEDCLFLNVYTKTLEAKADLPVMVYIHGEAFMSGSGNTDFLGPEFFLQHDVVIVTINYRLEVLGFLCLDTPEVPGNAGLKDQVAALRWIKENIAEFGGNPSNITLFGESAGSSSVTYHILSPMSKGLFHKAIAQSGVCFQDWSCGSDSIRRAFSAGKALGKETNDGKELLQYLMNVLAMDLARITFKTRTDDEKYRGLSILFTPCAEKKIENVKYFITEKPIDRVLLGDVNSVPLLLGYNTAEGMLMLTDQLKKSEVMNTQPSFFVPREIFQVVTQEKVEEFGERIKSFYFSTKDISYETAEAMVNLQTDIHFSYQTQRFAHYYSDLAPVYLYQFNYETELNVSKNLLSLPHIKGASHMDDLFYMFHNALNRKAYEQNEKLRQTVFQMTKFWTDFARTGNPTPAPHSEVAWPQYSAAGREYMQLQASPRAGQCADRERIHFWNGLYCDAGLPYITSS